jgi:hypothetical protein
MGKLLKANESPIHAIQSIIYVPQLPAILSNIPIQVSYISLLRGAAHLLLLAIPTNDSADKAMLVFDLISALVNFGLQQATSIAEVDAANTWKEYDPAAVGMGSLSSGLNAIAAVGYFTAFMFKLEDVEITALGVVVLEVGTVGLAVVEGILFKFQYDKQRKARMVVPSF